MTKRELKEYSALMHELSALGDEYALFGSPRALERIEEITRRIRRLDDYIDSVPSAKVRTALSLRYRRRKSWQYIAMQLGGYTGPDAPRKMCERWLSEH